MRWTLYILVAFASSALFAEGGPCADHEVWDSSMLMCMPAPANPVSALSLRGNAFAVGVHEDGARGRSALASPNYLMLDFGRPLSERQYLNVDVMATLERWTFPDAGYPLLGQIGESNSANVRYVDAQHPHSSPFMGLTLSDTISMPGEKRFVKVFFAPRGESTDGPIAFMHRPTGAVNPDAPLGHHVGQDVGHISSTVAGAALGMGKTQVEISIFNGTEPQPMKVDLPVATPNSLAGRLSYEFNSKWNGMVSAAYVKNPEPSEPALDHLTRYSASAYFNGELSPHFTYHNSLIYGLINGFDNVSALNSFTEEFLLQRASSAIWGRAEILQRTPLELGVTDATDLSGPRWLTAVTFGYTHRLFNFKALTFSAGASVTRDFLPREFHSAYGGDPWSERIFLQLSGDKSWDFHLASTL